jgi:hypothetical protein
MPIWTDVSACAAARAGQSRKCDCAARSDREQGLLEHRNMLLVLLTGVAFSTAGRTMH